MYDNFFKLALEEAKKVKNDIPVCAVITKDNELISIAVNKKEETNKTTAHAEILAIEEANKKLNSWRLEGCEMFVTLEPCPMCAWAVINSRIEQLYFGSYDVKYGAIESAINLVKLANSKLKVKGGIYEKECDKLLKDYFENLRNERKA